MLTNHNNNVQDIIDKKKWKLGKTFSKSIDMLVVTNKDPKNKYEKAKEKNIPILTSNEFKSKFGNKNIEETIIFNKSKKKPNKILLTNDDRNDLKEIAESQGIEIGKTFSKSIDLLVASDKDPKNKIKKALDKEIDIIENTKFIDQYQ